jgi:hypothetical protein
MKGALHIFQIRYLWLFIPHWPSSLFQIQISCWRIILKWILNGCEDIHWNQLAEDRNLWWALVNTIMNLGFNKSWGISWVAERLLASQGGPFCFKAILITSVTPHGRTYFPSCFVKYGQCPKTFKTKFVVFLLDIYFRQCQFLFDEHLENR